MANVYVDGEALFRLPDGVGRFTQRILSYTLQSDQANTYTALGFKGDETQPHLIDPSQLKYQYLPIPRKVYNGSYKLGKRIEIDKYLNPPPDVMLYPNFVTKPHVLAGKKIVVIHDLAFSHTPDVIERKNLKYLQKWVPVALNEANLVVGVSESTTKEIIELLNVKPEKVRTVLNAVDEPFFQAPDDQERLRVMGKFDLPEKFLLHLGTIEPRKNHLGLLEAYDLLPQSIKDVYPLVLAGGTGWDYKEIMEVIYGMQKGGQDIRLLGKVDDADLPTLYHLASAFALPSHFEGFGLPLAEAMAAGLPSVTSNRAPMTEIAGDAAVLVNPDDPQDIRRGLEAVLGNESLQLQLKAKAPQQVGKFNWVDSARSLQSVIAEVQEL